MSRLLAHISMNESLSTPKSLIEFKKKREEIQAFESFKETELNIHRGFKEMTRFDEQRAEFRTVAPRRETEVLRQTLSSALTSGDADLNEQAEALDWGGLLELYAEKTIENDKAKSNDSRVRGWFRKEAGVPSILHALTEMIPDDNGLSILRVGLAYIFLAWKRHVESRNRVLETLADVPSLLADVYDKRLLYEEDQQLSDLVEDFHIVLLDSLIRLAKIISPPQESKRKWFKGAWKKFSEQESKDVDYITSQISSAMTKVAERLQKLLHARLANVERISYDCLGILQEVCAGLHQLLARQEQDEQSRTQPSQVKENFRDNPFHMITSDMASVMQSNLYNILLEDLYIKHYQLWPERMEIARPRTPVMAVVLTTTDEMVRILKIQETDSSAEMDMKYVLRQANSMQQRGLSQARSLMTKDAFKSLLARDEPGILMVDGHCSEDGAGKTSPLSVWAASFAASLMQSDSLVVLHFFCGLHTRKIAGGQLPGPLGLIKSLIEQLVRQAGDRVSRMGTIDNVLAQQVMEDNFEAITSLFEPLLMTIDPGKTVFIIVDNVSEFEGVTWNEWSEQTRHIFKTLYNMVKGRTKDLGAGMYPNVKVLMTCANKSITLGRMVEDGEIVSLY